MFIHNCLDTNRLGHLTIGGADTIELAGSYGTPAYVMDESFIRNNCRIYKKALETYLGKGSTPVYASKALSFSQMYRIIDEEGLCADVVSSGEIYTAKNAGFPLERVYFHGNNKTDEDIRYGLESGVGIFVVDNVEELNVLNRLAGEMNKKQRILLRITPGIDPHTHKKISTGNIDSKFGTAIATGQAIETVKYALTLKNTELVGLHCHIGSQIAESEPYVNAVKIMIKFMAEIKALTGVELTELNLGGGFGVRYVDDNRGMDYDNGVKIIAITIKSSCSDYNIKQPKVMLEPGRSIVAAAGITLYTVGSVKEITGFKNYVSIDGGMPDNPRYALYQSQYDAMICSRALEERTYMCTIAGRCCESGDLIAENIKIQACKRGDILAVLVTGAYNYSMASNYNRLPRPPVIMIRDGKPYIAVERESYKDIIKNDRLF